MPRFCLFLYAVVNFIFDEALICRREMSLIGSTFFGLHKI